MIWLDEYLKKYRINLFSFIGNGIAFLILSLILYALFDQLKKNYNSKVKYRAIESPRCHQREYIYQIMKDPELREPHKLKFIRDIESLKVEVIGEWPSYDIFNSNENSFIRLAQLEEKWRGYNR